MVTVGQYDAQNNEIYIETVMAEPDESLTTPKKFMGTAFSYNSIITLLYHLPLPFDDIETNFTCREC